MILRAGHRIELVIYHGQCPNLCIYFLHVLIKIFLAKVICVPNWNGHENLFIGYKDRDI
jgi:hypothetical protein